MKQLVIVHGGDAFDSYDAYLEHLKKVEVRLEDFERRGWKSTLQGELGDAYQILPLRMPNASNATYVEWKIWFDKYVPFLKDGVVLVGHSLGGIFLAKYLSENVLLVRISGTVLIAPPYDTDSLGDFILPGDLATLEEQGGVIHLFHSRDDTVVPFGEMFKYKEKLRHAVLHEVSDQGHFIGETFPELVETIRTLVLPPLDCVVGFWESIQEGEANVRTCG